MNRVVLALACAGLFGAPAFAQEVEKEKDLASKSREELLAELHKLMKDASKEMDGLETELAKTSLGPPKADVVAQRMEKLREAMKKGELDELPEGLREYLKAHPEAAGRRPTSSSRSPRMTASCARC